MTLKTEVDGSVRDKVQSTQQMPSMKEDSKECIVDPYFDKLYGQCKYYYQEHDIDRAQHAADQLLSKYGPGLNSANIEESRTEDCIRLLRKVEREYKDVVAFNEEIYKVAWT